MGSIIGHSIDYNGVGALRSGTYRAKLISSTLPPFPHLVFEAIQSKCEGEVLNS